MSRVQDHGPETGLSQSPSAHIRENAFVPYASCAPNRRPVPYRTRLNLGAIMFQGLSLLRQDVVYCCAYCCRRLQWVGAAAAGPVKVVHRFAWQPAQCLGGVTLPVLQDDASLGAVGQCRAGESSEYAKKSEAIYEDGRLLEWILERFGGARPGSARMVLPSSIFARRLQALARAESSLVLRNGHGRDFHAGGWAGAIRSKRWLLAKPRRIVHGGSCFSRVA